MREILFRGKRKDNGEWIELSPNGTFTEFGDVDTETVGQYIGLTDKNGNKIFEGDIVDIRGTDVFGGAGPATYDEPFVVVTYKSYYAGFDPFANYDCDCDLYCPSVGVVVVGNIHDNPELLDAK